MSEAAKKSWVASFPAYLPVTRGEWRLLAIGGLIASVGLSIYFVREWTIWSRESRQITRRQAIEIQELSTDLQTAREELRILRAHNDLLSSRRQLARARRALELQRADDAQAYLAQSASFLKAVSPLALDVNAAKLERLKEELLLADLSREKNVWSADRRLSELAGEVDSLLGE